MDNTLLSRSDANLSTLKNKVNTQLQYIKQCLNQNKLTLNYFKTIYSLFNKYLGIWFDNKLKWSAHIQKLSLILARSCSMLYHLRDFVNAHALVKLHCSWIYSSSAYGTTARVESQYKYHTVISLHAKTIVTCVRIF